MPSQAEIEQHQADVEELSALAVAEVAALAMLLTGEDDEQSLVDAVPPILEQFMEASAVLAADWYRGLARDRPVAPQPQPSAPAPIVGPTSRQALLDARDFQPELPELPPREQVETSVRWAIQPPAPAPEPRETSALDVEEMDEDDLRTEVARLRDRPASEPVETATEVVAEQRDEEESDTRPTEPPRARITAPSEGAPRARVVGATEPPRPTATPESAPPPRDEAGPQPSPAREPAPSRARVIPAEATEQQARVISRLAGTTQRYVTSAARNTITHNATVEGTRWLRHAQADACAFCRMLATRGPAYRTRETASEVGASGRIRGSRAAGESYHDDCSCVPVPVRAGDTYEQPDYVAEWTDQYYLAVDIVGNAFNTRAILAEMRRLEVDNGGSRH
ncbi:VG15 protein [Nocardia rhizosphaerae]|uniref:Capsid maturation protease n=1 Tax=Nocardia rhizosphaerae TaxID=1691571 RepID=A0ABV8L3D5_9NOCA